MKIRVSFKTPDAVHYALQDSFPAQEDGYEEAKELLEEYIKYGENVTIEFDTENRTATVLMV